MCQVRSWVMENTGIEMNEVPVGSLYLGFLFSKQWGCESLVTPPFSVYGSSCPLSTSTPPSSLCSPGFLAPTFGAALNVGGCIL